jgi:dolichol-phosphate mannosyltransferase
MASQALSSTALVIVPTYNEAENINRLVSEILSQPAPLHVAIVDDNSPDGTGQLADALAGSSLRVTVQASTRERLWVCHHHGC